MEVWLVGIKGDKTKIGFHQCFTNFSPWKYDNFSFNTTKKMLVDKCMHLDMSGDVYLKLTMTCQDIYHITTQGW